MMEYTKRHNVSRGYMKLEVWNDAMELFRLVQETVSTVKGIDVRLKSQILDSTQPVSSNIAEGYCRRSLNEYLQFRNVGLGSSGKSMTRMIGLKIAGFINAEKFEEFDEIHFRVENKLIALIKSLQAKRRTGSWEDEFREIEEPYET